MQFDRISEKILVFLFSWTRNKGNLEKKCPKLVEYHQNDEKNCTLDIMPVFEVLLMRF